ncbi:MAG: type II toxin-antitoxin system RelB/DinJ family antitoxin [Chloroflexota bacterium]
MTNTTVQARISSELKQESEAVFSAIGLTTAEAIRLFLQQTVNSGGLPFQPTAKMPNAETLAAMNELEDNGGAVFSTADELFADWDS